MGLQRVIDCSLVDCPERVRPLGFTFMGRHFIDKTLDSERREVILSPQVFTLTFK